MHVYSVSVNYSIRKRSIAQCAFVNVMLRNYHVIIAAESAQLPRAQSKSVCLKQPTMPTEDFKESTWLMVSYSVN